MQEFMLFIRKPFGEEKISAEQHAGFLKGCEDYIAKLKAENKLVSAQPIEHEGNIVQEMGRTVTDFYEGNEVLGGYYHIRAKNLEEAVAIAKQNPEFKFFTQSRIEVRPLKTEEETTGYQYN